MVRHRRSCWRRPRSPDETASGWQQASLPEPGADHEGHDLHRVLLLAAAATSRSDPGYFSAAASTARRCTRLRDGVDGGNGVYHYGAERASPTTTFNATNYWVDASFDRTIPPDTRGADGHRAARPAPAPPTSPATTDVTATFDEPLAPASRHRARRSRCATTDGDLVPADVSYDAADADGEARRRSRRSRTPTTYTATLKGGVERRHGRRGQPARRRQDLVVHDRAPQPPGRGPGRPDPGRHATRPTRSARYYAEILRAEGLNEFDVADVAGHARRRSPATTS